MAAIPGVTDSPALPLSGSARGVAGDIALDSLYAGMIGARTNGHALQAANDFYSGPIPLHLFMQPVSARIRASMSFRHVNSSFLASVLYDSRGDAGPLATVTRR